MALASLVDLRAVCPTAEATEDEAAQAALDQATTILQTATGQELVFREGDRVLLDGEGARSLLLPQLPVTDVGVLLVEGVELYPDEFEWSATGILQLTDPCAQFPRRFQAVDVTYSHGFDPIPDDLVLAAARLACRLLAGGDLGGAAIDGVPIVHERIGSYSVNYSPGLSVGEQAVVNRYRVLA